MSLLAHALKIAADSQIGSLGTLSSTGRSSKTKMAAKRRARDLCMSYGGGGPQRVLDVGGEGSYRPLFEAVNLALEPLNLPLDMHDTLDPDVYDGALAMHVLEHSPAPLLVLLNIRQALTEHGWLYVAVPHPSRRWVRMAAHFSVLAPDGWDRLIKAAGFKVLHRESGKLEKRKSAVEERFICRVEAT